MMFRIRNAKVKKDINVALILVSLGRARNIKGVSNKYCNSFHSAKDTDLNSPTACILARKSLYAFLCTNLGCKDPTMLK